MGGISFAFRRRWGSCPYSFCFLVGIPFTDFRKEDTGLWMMDLDHLASGLIGGDSEVEVNFERRANTQGDTVVK